MLSVHVRIRTQQLACRGSRGRQTQQCAVRIYYGRQHQAIWLHLMGGALTSRRAKKDAGSSLMNLAEFTSVFSLVSLSMIASKVS